LKVLISTAPVYDMYHTEIQMFWVNSWNNKQNSRVPYTSN
jgi:hypothetical protein